MVVPIHFQRRRLTLALCLGLTPVASLGAAADWDCSRGKDDKEWVCATRKAPAPPAESPEPAPEQARPSVPVAPAVPVVTRRPPPPEPEAAPEPRPPVVTQHPSPPEPAPEPVTPEAPQHPAPVAAQPSAPSEPPEVALRSAPPPARAEAEPKPAQKPAAPAPRPGWNCQAAEGESSDRGWDCALTGPDPGGVARPLDEDTGTRENWADTTDLTPEDERRIQDLASLLPANPWQNVCRIGLGGGKRIMAPMPEFMLTPADKIARDTAPLDIHSNYFEMVDNEIANFSGGVEMVQADQKLWADFATRDTVTNAFNAHGRVKFLQKGLALASDTGFMDTDNDHGVFRNSQFILPTSPGRGSARLTYIDSSTLSRYEKATYTGCPPGNRDWLLHAAQLKINKETGVGAAQNAWIEFKNVPIFYTPYLSFPVDDRRKSGLLSPSIGTSSTSGFSLMTPYYFNLAPNYDYTFTPRYMTNRGFQLRNEFRYLSSFTKGRIIGDIVPHDDITNTTRGQAGFLNDTRFTDHLTSHIDANYVSDSRYSNQLGNPLNLTDWRYVRSRGTMTYGGDHYSISTLVDYFQTIDPTVPRTLYPYFHLPQVALNYYNEIMDSGLQFEGQVQFDSFANAGDDRTVGQRIKLKPRLYYPIQSAAGYITPSLSLVHNEYWLQNPEFWANQNSAEAQVSPSLTVPIASIDSGMYAEREFELGQTPMLQTLEPRVFYTYIPRTRQDSIPVFDSSVYDFTFYQLFRENRFTGGDRIGDTNQVSVALTSRLVDQSTGLERLRTSVGSAFYFADRQVTLAGPPPPAQEQSYSNLIGDVYAGLSEHWAIRTGGQWNPERESIDRGIISLQYNNRHNELFNAAYRFRRNQSNLECLKNDPNIGCLELTDVSFRLPVAEGWHAIGRWQYSLLDQVTLESFLGLERETCCWRFTLLARHYINGVSTDTRQNVANNGVFFQIELKGLASFGDEVDRFMERSISGYRFFPTY